MSTVWSVLGFLKKLCQTGLQDPKNSRKKPRPDDAIFQIDVSMNLTAMRGSRLRNWLYSLPKAMKQNQMEIGWDVVTENLTLGFS